MTVDRETAVSDFERICSFVDIDTEYSQTDEELKSFKTIQDKIIAGIERGHITVDEEGKPTLIVKDGKQLVFNEPGCDTEKAMDKKGENEIIGKIVAACASLTGVPPVTISKLKKRDWNYCKSLCTLFLADV